MPSQTDNARPEVDLRIVSFTFALGMLYVHIESGLEGVELPSAAPNPLVELDITAAEAIRHSLGFDEQYMEQLYSLSRYDQQQWTIIVSYLALVCSEHELVSTLKGEWLPAHEATRLSDADQKVVEYALFRLRAKLGYTTIAFHLMPDQFTLSEVQSAFETILGRDLDKRNFRRRMATLGILAPTSESRREGSHRPARLYRFRPDRDPTDYLTPPWATTGPEEYNNQ